MLAFIGGMVPTASQAIDPAITAVSDVVSRAQRPSVEETATAAARAEFRQLATADAIWDSLLRFTSAPGLVEPKFPPAQAPTRHAPGEPAATPYSSKAITRVNPYRTLNHES